MVKDTQERIKCDESGEILSPTKTWDSREPVTKRVRRYGTIPLHHHNREECPESGHAREVFRVDKSEVVIAKGIS